MRHTAHVEHHKTTNNFCSFVRTWKQRGTQATHNIILRRKKHGHSTSQSQRRRGENHVYAEYWGGIAEDGQIGVAH